MHRIQNNLYNPKFKSNIVERTAATIAGTAGEKFVANAAAAIAGATTVTVPAAIVLSQLGHTNKTSINNSEKISSAGNILPNVHNQEELSAYAIKKLIDNQRFQYTEKDINYIISSFKPEDQPIATDILNRITQFGNLEQLEIISNNVNGIIYDDSYPSIMSTMKYLCKYNNFRNKFLISKNEGTLILDELTLQRLQTSTEYLDEIKNNDRIEILIPEGWINGINPFNQTKDIKSIVEKFLIEYKRVKSQNPLSKQNDILSQVINRPIIEDLEQLGIKNKITILKNYDTNYNKTKTKTVSQVLSRLNPREITIKDLENKLNLFPPQERPYVLEYLNRTLQTNSTKSCSISLKQIHDSIVKLNSDSEEGIYYILPTTSEPKSYSLILAMYQIANNINPKYIIKQSDIPTSLPKDAKKVVILDDVSASGASLNGISKKIIHTLNSFDNNVSEVILSPIIATREALPVFENNESEKIKLLFMPNKVINNYKYSDYFLSLPKHKQEMFDKLIAQGFDDGCYSIAMPYMSPDNNSNLFANFFAKLFTLNGNGVKGRRSGDYNIKDDNQSRLNSSTNYDLLSKESGEPAQAKILYTKNLTKEPVKLDLNSDEFRTITPNRPIVLNMDYIRQNSTNSSLYKKFLHMTETPKNQTTANADNKTHVDLEIKTGGIFNYYQVDDFLSRSAELRAKDIDWLKSQNVTDIIDFRKGSEVEHLGYDECKYSKYKGIVYHNIPTNPDNIDENIEQFLEIINQVMQKGGKVHIHCREGADRTGFYTYIYERVFKMLSKQDAYKHLASGGWHDFLYPNIPEYAESYIQMKNN